MTTQHNDNGYDRKTLLTAAALFAGFVILVFFAPQIMLLIGGQNPYIAGGFVAGVIVLPFIGLWLRGRFKRS